MDKYNNFKKELLFNIKQKLVWYYDMPCVLTKRVMIKGEYSEKMLNSEEFKILEKGDLKLLDEIIDKYNKLNEMLDNKYPLKRKSEEY